MKKEKDFLKRFTELFDDMMGDDINEFFQSALNQKSKSKKSVISKRNKKHLIKSN